MPRLHTRTLAFVISVVVVGYQATGRTQRGGQPQPPTAVPPIALDATEDQIKQTVGAVRAGRKLTPKAWPNNARVAVALTFDIDNELLSRTTPAPGAAVAG